MQILRLASSGLAVTALLAALAGTVTLIDLVHIAPLPVVPLILVAALAACCCATVLRLRGVSLASRRAERTLEESQARFRYLIETAHEGIWLLDLEASGVFANRRLGAMLGLDPAVLVGRPAQQFLGETPHTALAALLDGSGEAGQTCDLCYRRQDRTRGWAIVSARPFVDDSGAASGTLLMLTDITERKQAEVQLAAITSRLDERIGRRTADLERANDRLRAEVEAREQAQHALAQSEQRLQEIVGAMPVALILKDADSNIVMMNKAAEDQSGMPFAKVVGTSGSDWFPPEQMNSFLAHDASAFASGELQVHEEPIWISPQHENRAMQILKKPVYDADGKLQFLMCMYLDVTERRRAESALENSFKQLRELTAHLEAIKEEERRRIASDIHDDLGQNLMALKIDIEMLHARAGEQHPHLRRRVGRVLDTVDATIRSVRAIINELHPSTLELGLPAALEWLINQFEKRSGIATTLSVRGDAGEPLDHERTAAIFRIVQESLLNILRHAEAMQVEVALDMHQQWLAITVVDDGIGMDRRAEGKDTAFGLRVIRERIEAYGGELVIDSRSGSGTTLSILIPIKNAAEQPTDVPLL